MKLDIVDTKETEVEFDLDFSIHSLLQNEPFFARVSRYITKYATYSIPTCGILLNKDTMNFELAYNPKFMASLSKEHQLGVLMHEFYHPSLGHCTSRKVEGVPFKLQNVAMDLAINSLPNMLGKLPAIACVPGVPGSFEQLPQGKAFEWYLKQLLSDREKNEGQDSFDSHDGWMEETDEDESMDNAKQIAKQKFKDIIMKAVEECEKNQIEGRGNAWGTVSQETRKLIKDSLAHKMDPKAIFSYFCKTSIRASRKHRITKINRRWAYIHPGRVWERRAKIGIAVDQSGSVSDEMLEKIFSWMNELAKFVEFTVIPFDDKVFEEKVYVWKKGTKAKRERVLCGGTNFNAPTDYVNKSDLDALVVFTDLCAEKPKKCRLPRLWLTDRYHAIHPYFTTSEKILVID